MASKKGKVLPKKGKMLPVAGDARPRAEDYARVVSVALRQHLGGTSSATKMVMRWTGASERTVKHWFAGTTGPSGEHLVALVRHSDLVLNGFLNLSGRDRDIINRETVQVCNKLKELLDLMSEMNDIER
ncbi:MAG: hypothetical protein WAW96_07540 [Alphaproteobacteria bacterium]